MIGRKLYIVLLVFVSLQLSAQDPHFSQYYFTPIELNPALSGVFEGKHRASISYRDQWSSLLGSNSFRTLRASTDIKWGMGKNDFLVFGMTLLGDEVGESNFRQSTGHLTVSYIMKLTEKKYGTGAQYLSGGIKVGAGINSADWSSLWFGRQYDVGNETINTGASNGESFDELNTGAYPDMGVGLFWYAITSKSSSVYAGFSMDHINKPVISLINSSTSLYQKWSFNMGGEMGFNNETSLMPSLLYLKQGPSRQINVGSQVRFSKREWGDVALRVGLFTRYANTFNGGHFDAFILTSTWEMGRFDLGLSYDVTTSNLETFNSRKGAFEISLTYVNDNFERKLDVTCPKF